MESGSSRVDKERVSLCSTQTRRPDEYMRISSDYFLPDFSDLEAIVHDEWATFTQRTVKLMRADKLSAPAMTTKIMHDFGQKAMEKVSGQINSLAADEELHRGTFYRDPDHVYNPEVDSDPHSEGKLAMYLRADVEFYRSAFSMAKRVEDQKWELHLIDVPNFSEPKRSTTLDPDLPILAMHPIDQENLEADLTSEFFDFDDMEAQTEEEEQEAIHVDEAAYKAMCLREALERAAAAAENGISETEMEPEYW